MTGSRRQHVLVLLAFATITMLFNTASVRASILLELDFEFSGATPPAGSSPWLTATFDDSIGGGIVRLTMKAAGLTASEFISGWYFNLNPALNPTLLAFTAVGALPVGPVAISKGTNAFKADGDGHLDFKFEFPTSGNRFTSGETVIYDITYGGAGTFNEGSFDFPSNSDKKGVIHSAAHVQGIGPSGANSGWVGAGPGMQQIVPEAASLIVWSLLIGSIGGAFTGRSGRRPF